MSRSCYSCGSTKTYLISGKYEAWIVNRHIDTGKEIGVICGRCYDQLDFRKRKKYGSLEEYAKAKRLTVLGENNPFYGKKHKPESKLLISIGKLGKSNSQKGRRMPQHAKFGEHNPRWKGGISKLSRRVRILAEYKEWRSKVFQRDGFTCQKCSRHGTYLHAHHIKPFYQILEENKITSIEQASLCTELWLLSNGQTLCTKCHILQSRSKLLALM